MMTCTTTSQYIERRLILFKSLVGSSLYGTNNETSDKDYCHFVCPSFNDLYETRYYHNESINHEEDKMYYDIRKLHFTIHNMEAIFSNEITVEPIFNIEAFNFILHHKHDIFKSDPKKLFDNLSGLVLSNIKKIKELNDSVIHRKILVNVLRYNDILHKYRFEDNNFQDLLIIKDKNVLDEFKEIKYGTLDIKFYNQILQDVKLNVNASKDYYFNQTTNNYNNVARHLIFEFVKKYYCNKYPDLT